MRKNKVIVRERDAKHRPRQHAHDGALKADCFFGIHYVDVANSAAPNAFGAGCAINSGSTGDCPQNGSRRKDADALRVDVLRSRSARGH